MAIPQYSLKYTGIVEICYFEIHYYTEMFFLPWYFQNIIVVPIVKTQRKYCGHVLVIFTMVPCTVLWYLYGNLLMLEVRGEWAD